MAPYSLPMLDGQFETFAKKQSKPAPKTRRTFKASVVEMAAKSANRGRGNGNSANRGSFRPPYK